MCRNHTLPPRRDTGTHVDTGATSIFGFKLGRLRRQTQRRRTRSMPCARKVALTIAAKPFCLLLLMACSSQAGDLVGSCGVGRGSEDCEWPLGHMPPKFPQLTPQKTHVKPRRHKHPRQAPYIGRIAAHPRQHKHPHSARAHTAHDVLSPDEAPLVRRKLPRRSPCRVSFSGLAALAVQFCLGIP